MIEMAGPIQQVGVQTLQDRVMPVTVSFSASTAAYTSVTGTLYPYGFNNASTSSFQIPSGNQYQLVDIYASSSPTPDYQVIFNLNGVVQGENFIGSTLVSSNSARAKVTQPLILNPSDVFQVSVANLATSPSGTTVITFYLQFLLVPK
jgi:hypothetical protein